MERSELPSKWYIETCKEVGDWLDEHSDLAYKAKATISYNISKLKYFVYPSFEINHHGAKSHVSEDSRELPPDYVHISIEEFRIITGTNKQPQYYGDLDKAMQEFKEAMKHAEKAFKACVEAMEVMEELNKRKEEKK